MITCCAVGVDVIVDVDICDGEDSSVGYVTETLSLRGGLGDGYNVSKCFVGRMEDDGSAACTTEGFEGRSWVETDKERIQKDGIWLDCRIERRTRQILGLGRGRIDMLDWVWIIINDDLYICNQNYL